MLLDIKKWKSDFEEERILHNVNKDLRKVEENMPKLIVDNDKEEEKVSDVFMVTKEFHTS